MKRANWQELLWVAIIVVLAAFWPMLANGYWLGIGVDMMMYIALATSWVLFSGPTHYISLASAAFFGVGGFIVGTGMSDYEASFWSMLALSAVVGGALAALIGLATLRLSGVYFVIFTLGLAEMIRNLVSWIQNNFLGSRGLYVLTDFTDKHLYWMLLVTAAAVYLLGWIISRSRLGFALRIIGGDETVARHVGINTAMAKVIL
ncbi:MAG: branched-chain amino acid ABC transporter permease, partial [Paracoccaceae bacterium]|nr:branched-chain amino acid ABC transporter permease [Paracoccaceae bacterium]